MANKIEVYPKVEEIKKVWLENQDKMSTHAIWIKFVEKYFKSTDMFLFYKTVQRWEKEIDKEKAERMTPEELKELNEENRKMTIIILNRILKSYQKNPKSYKGVDIKEISKLYGIIRAAEEATKRTQIAAHKEKRETVKTLLPYQRMSLEEIKKLKEKLEESFERIIQMKEGQNPLKKLKNGS